LVLLNHLTVPIGILISKTEKKHPATCVAHQMPDVRRASLAR